MASNKLIDAMRTGTAEQIALAAKHSDGVVAYNGILKFYTTALPSLAEAIVAARPKPEDVFPGVVFGVSDGTIVVDSLSHGLETGDRVAITKESRECLPESHT